MSNRPTHVVLRIIQGGENGDLYGGTPDAPVFVDASEWANTSLFEDSGHLRRMTDGDYSDWARAAPELPPADAEPSEVEAVPAEAEGEDATADTPSRKRKK